MAAKGRKLSWLFALAALFASSAAFASIPKPDNALQPALDRFTFAQREALVEEPTGDDQHLDDRALLRAALESAIPPPEPLTSLTKSHVGASEFFVPLFPQKPDELSLGLRQAYLDLSAERVSEMTFCAGDPVNNSDPTGEAASMSQSGWIIATNNRNGGRVRKFSPEEITRDPVGVRRFLGMNADLDPREADALIARAGQVAALGNMQGIAAARRGAQMAAPAVNAMGSTLQVMSAFTGVGGAAQLTQAFMDDGATKTNVAVAGLTLFGLGAVDDLVRVGISEADNIAALATSGANLGLTAKAAPKLLTAGRVSDEVIMANYQRYYDEAASIVIQRFNAGKISIPAGLKWKTVLGGEIDSIARARLRIFLAREGIAEGHGQSVLVNRWLRDPAGTGLYRIPDVRLIESRTILDGTIGSKTLQSPQVLDFIGFSGGDSVIIVRPRVAPGAWRR